MLRYNEYGYGLPCDGRRKDGERCGRMTRREGLLAGFRYCPAHREQAEIEELEVEIYRPPTKAEYRAALAELAS